MAENDEEYMPIEFQLGRALWEVVRDGAKRKLEWLYSKLVPF